MINRKSIKDWHFLQWNNPKRFLIKGNGIVIWKWSGVMFPCWHIYFFTISMGFDIVCHGRGFYFIINKLISIRILTNGVFHISPPNNWWVRIAYWNKKWKTIKQINR